MVNFKTMQQPTFLVTFFKSESIVRTIDIALVKFFIIATSIVFINIVIKCRLTFKLDHQVYTIERIETRRSEILLLSLALSKR